MMISTALALNAAILAAVFFTLWLVSLKLREVSYVDYCWAFSLGGLGVLAFLEAPLRGPRQWLLVSLAAVWGLRLGSYILGRWRKVGPDPRYQKILADRQARYGWSFAEASAIMVFSLQGALLFVVSLPVQLGQWDADTHIGALSVAGAVLALFGLIFESIGDAQLSSFRADASNKGKVLDSGLWRYTRHPNYFGETCFWWGVFLIAAQTPFGLWSLPGPIALTYLLTRVSGVTLLDERMQVKPDHAAYMARTSGFFPWFPKMR